MRGDRISLFGMKATGMNGKEGAIVSLPNSINEGRYGIQVDRLQKSIFFCR